MSTFGPRNVRFLDGIYEVSFSGAGCTAKASVVTRHDGESHADELKNKILEKLQKDGSISYTLKDGHYTLVL